MRSPGLSLLLCVVAAVASAAEDQRVTFLTRQLSGAKDPRVRAQTVLLLGQTGSDAAVDPLCGVLTDAEAIVRSAAANALGELRTARALACLKSALGEPDPGVRTALEKAMKAGVLTNGGLYLQVEPVQDKVGGLPAAVLELTERLLLDKLSSFGASLAPPNEDRKAAASLIKSRGLKGYALRMQLLPGATEKGLKLEMLIMSYPDQALKGTWNVKAAGGKQESLLKAMVPRVVDDAAKDLEWKN